MTTDREVMRAALEPCPFCGVALEFYKGPKWEVGPDHYQHPDNDCALAYLDWGDPLVMPATTENIERWNRRAALAAPVEQGEYVLVPRVPTEPKPTQITINQTQQNVLLAAAEALDDLGAPLNAADIRMIIDAAPACTISDAWISVETRLPEPDTDCLVLWRMDETRTVPQITRWEMQRDDPTGLGAPKMDVGYGWCDFWNEEVTHWMPLPAPPSKVEGK